MELGSVRETLLRSYEASSPEGFNLLRNAGLLDRHIAEVEIRLQEEGAFAEDGLKSDFAARANELLSLPSPDLIVAASELAKFPDDPSAWPDELDRHLAATSPEAHAAARRAGELTPQIRARIETAEDLLTKAVTNGASQPDALRAAKQWLLTFAIEIPPLAIFSDDPSAWPDELDRHLAATSPEAHAAARRAGELTPQIRARIETAEDLLTKAVTNGASQPDALRAAKQWLLAAAIELTPDILEAATFSDDPAAWPEELRQHIATGSPEAYTDALRAGRLDEHIGFAVAAAEHAFAEGLRAGMARDAAHLKATKALLAQASLILPSPKEILDAARNSRALSFQQMSVLIDRFNVSQPAARVALAYEVMDAIVQRPEFGSLLSRQAIFDRLKGGELFSYCLGAHHFGSGRIDEATSIFGSAVDKYGTPLAYQCLANCLRVQGEWQKALDIFERGMRSHAGDISLITCAAGTAFALGNVEYANELFAPVSEKYFSNFPRKEYIEQRKVELHSAIENGLVYREDTTDIYDDKFAYDTWWNYWFHFNSYDRYQHPEGVLADIVPDYIGAFFDKLPSKPKAFIEIGTMCGEIIYRVASENSDCQCFGVDRQENVKRLNDQAYVLPNLDFVADDIFACMQREKTRLDDGMLFHVRTSPFLYPAFLEDLYRRSGEFGIRYVALFETYPVSYERRRFQSFSDWDAVAEIRGGGLIHHNYPMALERAGFRIVEQIIAKPTLLFSGMDNSVFIVAERID